MTSKSGQKSLPDGNTDDGINMTPLTRLSIMTAGEGHLEEQGNVPNVDALGLAIVGFTCTNIEKSHEAG